YVLDTDAVALGEPEDIAEAPEIIQYQVSATGVARAVFTAQEQQALATSLVGASKAEARAALAARPAIIAADIAYTPGWWFERMPRLESRITVEIHEGAGPVPDGTPPATPDEDSAYLSRPSALGPRPFS
ncbi:MAG: hypothetical protein H0W06_03900, partial [Chloroflexia bacterium]|nr:hypothetical protein [Chloroflexia bacterium]